MANSPKGRPKGSESREYDVAVGSPTRCRACGSTDRAPYLPNPTIVNSSGISPVDGKPYDRIVIRRTKCLGCGQHRLDKIYEQLSSQRA